MISYIIFFLAAIISFFIFQSFKNEKRIKKEQCKIKVGDTAYFKGTDIVECEVLSTDVFGDGSLVKVSVTLKKEDLYPNKKDI